MTSWKQVIELGYVPEDIQELTKQKCVNYEKNGYKYKDTQYVGNEQYQTQKDLNAFIDEEDIKWLLNNDSGFRNNIDALLAENITRIITGKHLAKQYDFNKSHGLTDHSMPTLANYETSGSWVDLVRSSEYDADAIWSIEVKTTVTYAKAAPSKFHKADLVIAHYIDADKVVIYAPTVQRNARNDGSYIILGEFSVRHFANKRVTKDWKVVDF